MSLYNFSLKVLAPVENFFRDSSSVLGVVWGVKDIGDGNVSLVECNIGYIS